MSPRLLDRALTVAVGSMALVGGSLILFIVLFLAREALPALQQIGFGGLFSGEGWHPLEGQFDMSAMVLGSLLVALGATLVATPLGVLSGVFSVFYAPKAVAAVYRRVIELLAGTPSVVYGLWGLVVLAPMIASVEPPGTGLITGVLVLAIMILPTITLTSAASLMAVPKEYLAAADALALSRWTMVRTVALPSAASGILTGLILALGRAIGETMAVLMVCGNVVQVPDSMFSSVRVLTANIALEMAYAMDLHRSALFISGLLLVTVVVGLVFLSELVQRRAAHA